MNERPASVYLRGGRINGSGLMLVVCGGRVSPARIMSCGMRSRRNVSTVTLAGVYSAPIPLALPPSQGASALLRFVRRCRWFRCSVVKHLCHSVPVPIFGPFARGDERNSTPTGEGCASRSGIFPQPLPFRDHAETRKDPPTCTNADQGVQWLLRRSSGDAVEGVVRQRRIVLSRLDGRPARRACHGVDVARLGDALGDVAGTELVERGVHAQ